MRLDAGYESRRKAATVCLDRLAQRVYGTDRIDKTSAPIVIDDPVLWRNVATRRERIGRRSRRVDRARSDGPQVVGQGDQHAALLERRRAADLLAPPLER